MPLSLTDRSRQRARIAKQLVEQRAKRDEVMAPHRLKRLLPDIELLQPLPHQARRAILGRIDLDHGNALEHRFGDNLRRAAASAHRSAVPDRDQYIDLREYDPPGALVGLAVALVIARALELEHRLRPVEPRQMLVAHLSIGKILGIDIARERQHHVERPAARQRRVGGHAVGAFGERADQPHVDRMPVRAELMQPVEQLADPLLQRRKIAAVEPFGTMPGNADTERPAKTRRRVCLVGCFRSPAHAAPGQSTRHWRHNYEQRTQCTIGRRANRSLNPP